jgi:hypothetical protein
MIWSMLMVLKPGSCAITAEEAPLEPVVPLALPADEVDPVTSLLEPEELVEPEEPELPASAVVEEEPEVSALPDEAPDVSDEPEVEPEEPASAVVELEPEAVPDAPLVPVAEAVDMPDAAWKPLR